MSLILGCHTVGFLEIAQRKSMSEENKIELKPCPFCGGEAEIETFGNRRQSTIYACTNCGCRLETNEERGVGERWNTRADNPRIAELERENFGQSGLIRSLRTENDELRAELDSLKTWDGVMMLVNKTYPPNVFLNSDEEITETNYADFENTGVVVVNLIRRLNELRADVKKWRDLAGKKAI